MAMNKRNALVIGSLVLLGAGLMFLIRATVKELPEPRAASETVASRPQFAAAQADAVASAAADAARRGQTAAAFLELQASRKALQRQLGDLQSRLWGRELPAQQARSISRDMLSGQYLLKNPALLGAFSDADGVYAEKDRVDAARVRLQEISRTVGEPKTP